jgi:hypothetical protein
LNALARFEAVEHPRNELRGVLAWIASADPGRPAKATAAPTPLKRNTNGDRFLASELVEALRDAVANSSVERQHERVAERAELEYRRAMMEATASS